MMGAWGCPVATGELDRVLALDSDALGALPVHLGRLQDLGPVVWVDELEAYAITRYDTAVEVLFNPQRFSSALGDPRGPKMRARVMAIREELAASSEDFRHLLARLEPDWRAVPVLAAVDPPVHTVHRRLVNRLFTPRRVREMEGPAREIADELIDGFDDAHEADLVTQFAALLPLRILADQLAIGESHLHDFKRWADDVVAPIGNLRFGPDEVLRMTRSCVEFSEHFRPLLAERRSCPVDDFLTLIAEADDDEVEITDEHRLGIVFFLLTAGIETSTKMLAAGAATLEQRPDIGQRLLAQPDLVHPFVDEVLRLNAPLAGLYRYATADTELAGVQIPSGASIWVLYGAASRDPHHFNDAHEFRLDRPANQSHLAFSHGIHFCAGASLARMEGAVGVQALLDRVYPWSITYEERDPSYILAGHRHLKVRFGHG